jgi:tRNA pseudouridine38-40 synthase
VTFKITLAYDGTDYVGWQLQANGVSIQGLLEDALRAIDGRDVRVTGAGRTDAGVHALGQVASFTIQRALTADTVVRAVNAHLPGAVRVLSAEAVPETFHPRSAATAKTYRYRIWNGEVVSPFERRYAWHITCALDVEAMRAAATIVEGRHDFAAFQAAGSEVKTTVREIYRSALRTPHPALLEYEITGTGFLRHMVRAIVGTVVEVGRGRQPVEWIAAVLASRDRTMAGPTAPPEGLFLVSVDYADSLAAKS